MSIKKMYYKNISKKTQVLIGYGVVEPDEIFRTNEPINNPNFKLVKAKGEDKKETNSKKVK